MRNNLLHSVSGSNYGDEKGDFKLPAIGRGISKETTEMKNKANEERRKNNEDKEKFINDWGMESEESKKIMEARYNQMQQRKKKSKPMNAEERYKKFLVNTKR